MATKKPSKKPVAKSGTAPGKSGPGSIARTIGPAVPLAIALVSGSLIPGGPKLTAKSAAELVAEPVRCEESVEDFQACHSAYPAGCSPGGGSYDPYLNLLKNEIKFTSLTPVKFLAPEDYQRLEDAIPSGLAKGNHRDFQADLEKLGEHKIHGVVGFLYQAKAEGKESSNCGLEAGDEKENVDYHIWIGFDPNLAHKLLGKQKLSTDEKHALTRESAIVEMTPHYRAKFKSDWTIDRVTAQVGKKVLVVGQLMVDNEHNVPSQNCGRKDADKDQCWRMSVWELHPVTRFQVCGTGDTCTAGSSTGWVDLEELPDK